MKTWHPFLEGKTLGQSGSESGVITLDEAHDGGARITIERNGSIAPWSITCGISGWMMHTRFFDVESKAQAECEKMKGSLSAILEVISKDTEDDSRQISQLIAQFVVLYP